ncbi:MAG: hypothetical protein DSY46_03100 [Hydrogenimonas sp.]|nr:MAG: hypothetical protein DSY46_03100 [Hydrogenimonas sp.]
MKVIYSLFFMFLSFFMVGCGSTGSDGIGSQAEVTVAYKSLSSDATSGTLILEIQSTQSDDMQVMIKDINLSSSQYDITITSITQNEILFDQSGTVELTVTFNYTAAATRDISKNDLVLSYQEVKISKLTNHEVVEKKEIPLSVLPSGLIIDTTTTTTTTTTITAESLEIIPFLSNTTITQPGDTITITVQVNINKVNAPSVPAVGQNIFIETFDPQYGSVDSYIKTTDVNGRVVFTYQAPSKLPLISKLPLEIYSAQDMTVHKEVEIFFASSMTDISQYQIKVPATTFTVTQPLEKKTIEAYVIDGNNRPVSGINLLVDFFDPKQGKMSSYSGVTNANGQITLTYTAPSDIASLNGQSFSIHLYLEQNSSIEQNLTIHFGVTNARKDFTLRADSNVTVAQSGSSSTINVTLSYQDENNITHPAVGETIIADFLQPMYGKLGSYKAVTDASGIATFTYTSPDRLQYVDGNETNLTFYWEQNVSITGATRLIFNAQTDGQIAKLYVVPSELIVTEPNQQQTLQIVTVNANNVGISTNVQIEQLANGDGIDYGVFDRTTVTTDASGRAEILYTAPSALPNAERNITLTELSQNISANFTLRFQNATETNATLYDINVSTENSLEVDSEGRMTVTIHEVNNPNNLISPDYVYDVNVSSRFANLLDFNGTSLYHYSGTSVKVITATTKTLSGVALLDINATIFDGEKNTTINKTIPVVIMSGPVSALSLVYASSKYYNETGLFEDVWTIHAVDKYSNPAQPGTLLHPTLINGKKIINYTTGSIVPGVPVQFKDATNPFANIDVSEDRLIVLPYVDRLSKAYLGGWTISSIVDNGTLDLNESYYDQQVDQLKYIIGSEKRVLRDQIVLADIKSKQADGSYAVDENGTVQFVVKYDPLLPGHTYVLAATAYTDSNRSGTSVVTNFRGTGFSSSTEKIPNDGNDHDVIKYFLPSILICSF